MASLALKTRIEVRLFEKDTTSSLRVEECPTMISRSSAVEWSESSKIFARGSANTVAASSKVTRCFRSIRCRLRGAPLEDDAQRAGRLSPSYFGQRYARRSNLSGRRVEGGGQERDEHAGDSLHGSLFAKSSEPARLHVGGSGLGGCSFLCSGGSLAAAGEVGVDDRHDDEGQHRREEETSNDRHAQGLAALGAGA